MGRRARARAGDDRGSITLWSLAICVGLLALGGITLDFWRALSGWRSLAAAADAAAAAGASGIDEATFRSSGGEVLQLDPARAEQLAYDSLAAQVDDGDIDSYQVTATAESVTVVIEGSVDLTLPQVVMDGDAVRMSVTATADPRLSG
jgi:Flp pilus assembly protein TadG